MREIFQSRQHSVLVRFEEFVAENTGVPPLGGSGATRVMINPKHSHVYKFSPARSPVGEAEADQVAEEVVHLRLLPALCSGLEGAGRGDPRHTAGPLQQLQCPQHRHRPGVLSVPSWEVGPRPSLCPAAGGLYRGSGRGSWRPAGEDQLGMQGRIS